MPGRVYLTASIQTSDNMNFKSNLGRSTVGVWNRVRACVVR